MSKTVVSTASTLFSEVTACDLNRKRSMTSATLNIIGNNKYKYNDTPDDEA